MKKYARIDYYHPTNGVLFACYISRANRLKLQNFYWLTPSSIVRLNLLIDRTSLKYIGSKHGNHEAYENENISE